MPALDIVQGTSPKKLGSGSDNQNPQWQYVKSVSTTNNVSYKELDDGYYKLTFLYNDDMENKLEFKDDVDLDIWYIVCGGGGGGGAANPNGIPSALTNYYARPGGGGSGGMTITNLDESSGITSEVILGITVGDGGPENSDGGDSTLILYDETSIVAKGGNKGGSGKEKKGLIASLGGASVYPNGDDGEKSTLGQGATYPNSYELSDAYNGLYIENNDIYNKTKDFDANCYYGWGGPCGGNFQYTFASTQSKYGSYTNDGTKSYTNPINANPPRLYGGGGGKGGNINSSGGIGQIGSGGVQGVIIIYYKLHTEPEQDP